MGIATGEVFSHAEGRLYLYASASGTASGSGVAYAERVRLRVAIGWQDWQQEDGAYRRAPTGRLATLTVERLHADRALFALAAATAAVNARFEALVTAGGVKSALFALYSGVIDSLEVEDRAGDVWRGPLSMHANEWSGFGQ